MTMASSDPLWPASNRGRLSRSRPRKPGSSQGTWAGLACAAGLAGALAWGVAGCDGGGGAGGSGGSGDGASGSGASGGSGPGCGEGCPPGEVCVNDACEAIPDSCPCPLGTYCNEAENVCVLGCQTNEHCGPGTVCDAATAACVPGCQSDGECGAGEICKASVCQEGCHDETGCPEGSVCVNEHCQEGCSETADCTVPGTVCTNNSCACPGTQVVCDGACTPIDTTQSCGGCGVVCDPGATCEGGQCACAPGVCEPGLVGSGLPLGYCQMILDGDFIYWLDGETKVVRTHKVTGAANDVVSDTKISSFQVLGANLLYTGLIDGNTYEYDLKKVASAGGSPSLLDNGTMADAQIGMFGTNAYWYRSGAVRSLPVAGGNGTVLVSGWHPASAILVNAQGVFWAAYDGGAFGGYHVVRHHMGQFTDLHNWEGVSGSPFVVADTEHVYFNQVDVMKRVPVNGGQVEVLASGQYNPHSLAIDGTHLYWVEQFATGKIKRVPKGGGAEEVLLDLNTYPHHILLDDQFFYWGDSSGQIWKLAK